MADSKGLLMALVGSKKPPASKAEAVEDEPMDGKATAARELMDALKADDVAGFSSALESFVSMCGADYTEE